MRILFSIIFAINFLITSQAFSTDLLNKENIEPVKAKAGSSQGLKDIGVPSIEKRIKVFPHLRITSFMDPALHKQMDEDAKHYKFVIFLDLDLNVFNCVNHYFNMYPERQKDILNKFFNVVRDENLYQHSNEFQLFRSFLVEEAGDPLSPYNLINQQEFVENCLLPFINKYRDNAVFFGLTSRKAYIAKQTEESLGNLGINFTGLCGLGDSKLIAKDIPYHYQNGIFYTSIRIKKCYVVNDFLNFLPPPKWAFYQLSFRR